MRTTCYALLLASGSMLAMIASAEAAKITITCGSVGAEQALCRDSAEAWAQESGHEVEIVAMPQSSSEQLALYQQMLSSGQGDIDVMQIDIVWPSLLGSHLVDMRQHIDQEVIDSVFPGIIEGLSSADGQLLAMPWFTDAPLLFYRTDLLEKYNIEVPATWQEMTEAAQTIQEGERTDGNDRFWGFVFQGKAYEGLTCDALEWVNSASETTIVEPDGSISINNPEAAAAVDLAASWINTISPPDVLGFQEEESRGVFQTGNAAFMRNWPYAYALANGADSPVAGKVGVVPLPRGGPDGKSAATLGGWQLAVSKYSANPEIAADLVRYLTSTEEQKRRAITGGYAPTYPALYQDNEVINAVPYFETFATALEGAVARPSTVTGERYNEVSAAFYNAVHATLSGNGDGATNLAALEKDLIRMSRGGRW